MVRLIFITEPKKVEGARLEGPATAITASVRT